MDGTVGVDPTETFVLSGASQPAVQVQQSASVAPVIPPFTWEIAGSPLYQEQMALAPRPDVTVTAQAPKALSNADLQNGNFTTGILSVLQIRITESGIPMSGLIVTETNRVIASEPPIPLTQNQVGITTESDGSFIDVVSGRASPPSPILLSPQQASQQYMYQIRNRTNVVTEQTLMIAAPGYGLLATATYQRTFSNLDSQGSIRPGNDPRVFRINITPVIVTYPRP